MTGNPTDFRKKIRDLLIDVDYPATKDELLAAAVGRAHDDDVLKALRAMPPVDYRSESEVLASVDRTPTGSDDPASQRRHTHPGLAQHMKEGEPTPIEREVGSNEGS